MNEGDKTQRNQGFSRLAEAGFVVGGAGFYVGMGDIFYELATHFNDPEKIQANPLMAGGAVAAVIGTIALAADLALDIRRRRKEAQSKVIFSA